MLQLEQLDAAEKELVNRDLRGLRASQVDLTEREMARSQVAVLAEWGIVCPHPSSSLDPIERIDAIRVKAGKPVVEPVCNCDACGATVFPLQWRIELERILAKDVPEQG